MLLQKYNKRLSLDLQPSYYLFLFIVLIHVLALSVLSSGLNIYIGALLVIALLVIISLYRSLIECNSVRFKHHIINIESSANLSWHIHDSNDKLTVAVLQNNWYILPYLIILNFKQDNNQIITLIIVPDMISNAGLRELKLHLLQIKRLD